MQILRTTSYPEEVLHVAMLRSHRTQDPQVKADVTIGKSRIRTHKTVPYKDAISQTKKMLQRLDKM